MAESPFIVKDCTTHRCCMLLIGTLKIKIQMSPISTGVSRVNKGALS